MINLKNNQLILISVIVFVVFMLTVAILMDHLETIIDNRVIGIFMSGLLVMLIVFLTILNTTSPKKVEELEHRIQERTAALQQSEEKYRKIFENIQDVFYQTNLKGLIVEISPSIEKYSGYSREELLGRNVRDMYYYETDRRELLKQVMAHGQVTDFEVRLHTKDNRLIYTSVNAHLLLEKDGKAVGIEGSLRDVTARKETQDALRESEERFRSISSSAHDAIIMLDEKGNVTYWNEAAADIFGYEKNEIMGHNFHDLTVPSRFHDAHQKGFAKFIKTGEGAAIGQTLELQGIHKEGHEIPVELSLSAFQMRGKWHGIGIVRDITERKRLEGETQKLLMAITQSPATVVITDREGTIEYVNPKFTEVTGYTIEEATGQNPRILKTDIHSKQFHKNLWDTILAGEDWHGEFCNKKKNGDIYWESASISPIRNEKEEITHFVAVKEDITERKHVAEELEKAKEVAETANKTKSEFLANMSHEIRTPMNAILGFTEILGSKVSEPTLKGYIDSIQTSGKTLLQLINDILDLSKIEAGKLEMQYAALNITSIFNEIQQIFSFKVKEKGIEFKMEIDPALPQALVLDEIRLRQILLNLVGNAVKFTSEGFIQLSAHKFYTEEDHSMLDLYFAVSDTGMGIPKEQQDLIFDAFQQQTGQSHAKYGGTGLGLSITKRLVNLMGGSISVESDEGAGTVFQVVLKNVAVASVLDAEPAALETEAFGNLIFDPATILVVDDIQTNRTLIQGFLEDHHFQVLEAANGRIGYETAKEKQPDLILMDLKMPEMDGYEATRLIKNDPETKDIPVVVLTASAMKGENRKVEDLRVNGYLQKPIARSVLLNELSRFLAHTKEKDISEPDLEDAATLSDLDEKEKIHYRELIEILESQWIPAWEKVKETFIIGEIETFGKSVQEVATKKHVEPVKRWAEQLLSQVDGFDMENIPNTLNGFLALIEELKRRVD